MGFLAEFEKLNFRSGVAPCVDGFLMSSKDPGLKSQDFTKAMKAMALILLNGLGALAVKRFLSNAFSIRDAL
jgi:hypothetical protein